MFKYLLRQNIKAIIIENIIVLIAVVVCLAVTDIMAYSHYERQRGFFVTSTNTACLYDGYIQEKNAYVYCASDIACYCSPDSQDTVPAEVIMQSGLNINDDNYISEIYGDKLGENEIVISKGIAEKYRLRQGDKLYLDVGITLQRVSFTVKYIMQNRPALFGASGSQIVLIGYSDAYVHGRQIKSVVFYSGAVSTVNAAGLLETVHLKSVARRELALFVVYMSLGVIIIAATIAVASALNEKRTRRQILKLKRLGIRTPTLIAYKAILNAVGAGLIIILPAICLAFLKSAALSLLINCVIFFIAVFVGTIVDGFKYKTVKVGKDGNFKA